MSLFLKIEIRSLKRAVVIFTVVNNKRNTNLTRYFECMIIKQKKCNKTLGNEKQSISDIILKKVINAVRFTAGEKFQCSNLPLDLLIVF